MVSPGCPRDLRRRRFARIAASWALLAAAATPGAWASCQSNTLVPGDVPMSMTFGGRTRTFKVHVPAGYTGRRAVPLVVDMHGFTITAAQQEGMSGFRQKSDQAGFIVVWPQGVNNSWNAFGCCGDALSQNIDDVGFLRAMVNQIAAIGNIDHSRIYATGHSNGGSMSHRLACQAADLFAAVAPVAFPLNVAAANCTPSRPITVVHFHGLNDTLIPYNGGGIINTQSAQTSLATWKQIDGCIGNATVLNLGAPNRCETFTTCNGGVHAALCSLSGTHFLYDSQTVLNIANYAWDTELSHFQRPLPDQDGDGIPNQDDNCPSIANPTQADADGDCIGDPCDTGPTTSTTVLVTTTTTRPTTTTTLLVTTTTSTMRVTTSSVVTTTVTTTTSGPGGTTTTTTPAAAPLPISGHKLTLKDRAGDPTRRTITFVSKDPILSAGVVSPTVAGASVHVFNAAGGGDSACFTLPASGWTSVDGGFKYKDAGLSASGVKVALLKGGKILKVSAKGSGPHPITYSLDEPVQTRVAVVFRSGATAWCATFGGYVRRDTGVPTLGGGGGQFAATSSAPDPCPVPPASCP